MSNKSKFRVRVLLLSLGVLCAVQSQAAHFSGTVEWMEVWPSGNIAFRLAGVTEPCTQQTFIINKSNEGAKNLYALLLTAKAMGTEILVAQTSCGGAEGYGGSYAIVDYMYTYW